MDIITIFLSIIGTLTGVGALYLTYRQIRIARQANLIQAGQRSRFPFDILEFEDFAQPKILQKLLLPNADLAFTPRLPEKEYEETIKKWLEILNGDNPKVLIKGNTGIGKTREALEVIRRLEKGLSEGSKLTILMPRPDMDIPLETPDNLPLENLVLFINDLHVKYNDTANNANLQLDGMETESFHVRLKRVINFFNELTKGYGQFRVIATTRSEPELWHRISPQDEMWRSFNIIDLPLLAAPQARKFAENVATKFEVSVSNEAKSVIAENNDGTYSGIIVYITAEKQAGNTQLSVEMVRKNFTGIYRDVWKNRVYNPFIKNYPARESIIKTMSILYQANFPLYKEVILMLSPYVWETNIPVFLRKNEIKKSLQMLSLWINDDGILLNCPEFFLEGQNISATFIDNFTSKIMNLGKQKKWKNRLFNPLFNFGIFLSNKYFTDQALRVFSLLATNNPNSAETIEYYSYILFWAGYFEQAQSAAEKAILLNPISPRNYLVRADSMAFQGNLAANTSYITAIRLGEYTDHYLLWTLFNYCDYLQTFGRENEAIEFLTKITELSDNYLSAYSSLALLMNKQGNHEEAQKLAFHVEKLLESSTDWSTTGYKISASLLRKIGKLNEAVVLYNKAIELGQNNLIGISTAYLGRAICLLHLGQKEKAFLDLKLTTELSLSLLKRTKKNYDAMFSLAYAHILLGNRKKAQQYLKRAKQICPTNFVFQDWTEQIQEAPIDTGVKNYYLALLKNTYNMREIVQHFQTVTKSFRQLTKENRKLPIDQVVQLTRIRDQAIKMQKSLQAQEIEISEGNVKIILLGDQTVKSVLIDGVEQEFLTVALNKAIKESQREAALKLQEMSKDLMQLLGR